MKDRLIEALSDKLDAIGVRVYDVYLEMENGTNYLRVVLDSDKQIDVNMVVNATHIISPIIDKLNLVNDQYILDIFGRSKGE